ncbi:hypothetical protein NDU88_006495 [Pleurodeles waltl]|uniref:Uncharacterized protein n=1 Tax=Pleurodeles waltl TaxID=8319 RepID=A0AAV7UL65_PLEWA|nr:hypothetical protein NDU88_006495 [Pleurodeles waltl]
MTLDRIPLLYPDFTIYSASHFPAPLLSTLCRIFPAHTSCVKLHTTVPFSSPPTSHLFSLDSASFRSSSSTHPLPHSFPTTGGGIPGGEASLEPGQGKQRHENRDQNQPDRKRLQWHRKRLRSTGSGTSGAGGSSDAAPGSPAPSLSSCSRGMEQGHRPGGAEAV